MNPEDRVPFRKSLPMGISEETHVGMAAAFRQGELDRRAQREAIIRNQQKLAGEPLTEFDKDVEVKMLEDLTSQLSSANRRANSAESSLDDVEKDLRRIAYRDRTYWIRLWNALLNK